MTLGALPLGLALSGSEAHLLPRRIDANARSRLNAVFIIWGFLGQVTGTQVGTHVFEAGGWRAAGALYLGCIGGMLLLLLARGPWCPNGVWVGGWGYRAPRNEEAQGSPRDEERGGAEMGGETMGVAKEGNEGEGKGEKGGKSGEEGGNGDGEVMEEKRGRGEGEKKLGRVGSGVDVRVGVVEAGRDPVQ